MGYGDKSLDIDGKRYLRVDMYRSKREAKGRADREREKGKSARVVRRYAKNIRRNLWDVYVR